MDRYSRMQYLKSIYKRYHKSNRKQKEEILNEFCKNCGYNRKYAIRILNDSNPQDKELAIRKRETVYSSITLSILKAIWEAAGWPWSVRLKALLQLWLPWAKKRFQITPETEKQLLSISTATIDRRLKPIKNRIKKRIFSTTRPGTLLKNMIPIKTHSWNIRRPGFLEVDIVAHCGSSLSGDFVNSLNTVDILTGWTETRAILGKSQFAAFSALNEIKDSLPFKLLGIDPDNDGVFINHHLHAYCKKSKIQFTRSRPYKKNDNAHIEQKNYTHVRKIFGYARYESQEACDAMNNLYRSELCWFQNLFQPSVKLRKKIRIGSKLKRVYSDPKTPFQRLCEYKNADPKEIKQLKQIFVSLDPFMLSQSIDLKLKKIQQMVKKRLTIQKTFEDRLYAEIKRDFVRSQYTTL